MKIRIYTIIILLMITIISGGCKKYLDAKPDQSLVIISNLNDLQSILDNYQKINVATLASDIVSGDDYYLTYMDYQAMALQQYRNMYTWQPSDLFDKYTSSVNDWGQVYNCIYLANTVLKNISNVDRTTGNASEWDNIKGQALFLRAYSLYKAATVWSLAYDDKTSNHDLGLPLRLDPDFNTQSVRSTVAETYKQILSDAQTAADLLPISPLHVTRSAKPAAYALLAKVYLAMRNYEIAGINADKCLKINNILIDYNTLNPSAAYPMSQFNKETIYYTVTGGITGTPVSYIYARTDTTLYKLYDINDLRKSVFFNKNTDGTIFFRGSYSGSSIDFNGIATDEIFLIRAECYARNGKIDMALSDLNTLLTNRYKKGTLIASYFFQ